MPLPAIADALTKPPDQAADAVGEYWEGIESVTAERRALVFYIQARLTGANVPAYNIETRTIPDRSVAAIHRHVHANQTNSFFVDAFARLRAVGDGLEGIEGVPFVIFYGEVSDDSDGPIELCRPIATLTNSCRQPGNHDPDIRVEPAHEEAYIRLAKNEIGWPAMQPACDALEAWTSEHNRQPAGPPRQVLIADQRTATPDTPVCDLSLPLKPRPQ